MKYEISVIIATFNSGLLLPRVLDSLQKQTFPKNKIETLLIDGGSTDMTRFVAKQYGCTVIDNPRTEPVFAKFLGYKHAKGRYIVYLDHDEVLENRESMQKKYNVFLKEKKVHAVIGSGYKSPSGYPFINEYINEFGDPFSFFIYRLSKDARFFLPTMKRRYKVYRETTDAIIFDLKSAREMPLIELCAAASMFDGEYMKHTFPETLEKPDLIPHFFYIMHQDSALIAITKSDALIHYSADTLRKYLAKIRWRIKNNIYHVKDMGASGFTGRQVFQSKLQEIRKYVYLPYVFSLIFPFVDAIALVKTRRNILYLLHVPLSLYTGFLIVYHLARKIGGKKQVLKSYDEKKVITAL